MNTHDVQERSWVHPLEGARFESAPQVAPRGVPTMKRLWIIATLSTVCLVGPAHAHNFQNAHDYCEQRPGALRLGESVNLCADRITEAHASKPGHARTLEEACKHRDGDDCNLLIDH